MPSVPIAPAINRAISNPATFFITSPPNRKISPFPFSILTPSTKSRTAPLYGRRGPASPAATAPPIVVAAENRGGSKPGICCFDLSNSSNSPTRVPAAASPPTRPDRMHHAIMRSSMNRRAASLTPIERFTRAADDIQPPAFVICRQHLRLQVVFNVVFFAAGRHEIRTARFQQTALARDVRASHCVQHTVPGSESPCPDSSGAPGQTPPARRETAPAPTH